MAWNREPPEFIRHMVGLYYRGSICPAELWHQIASVLTPDSASATLEALPADTQRRLRAVFEDRPSLPAGPEFAAVCGRLAEWFDRGTD